MCQVSFFLGTKITGMTQRQRLFRTYPWSKSSWTCRWISLVSSGLVLYVTRFGNIAPGIKSIWCSIPLKGGSPRGMSAEKTSLNSGKRLVIVWDKGMVISSKANNTCLHTKAWIGASTMAGTKRSDLVSTIAWLFNLIALELEGGAGWSHYTISFEVRGSKVIFFPLCTRVYLLLLPWWIASKSNFQGWPNKREHACIRILISTNRKVDACYMSYLGLTTIVEPLNIVWMVWASVVKPIFITKSALTKLLQLPPSMMVWTWQSFMMKKI
jgi:hypothetical protein